MPNNSNDKMMISGDDRGCLTLPFLV